jgi:hypothetical protein
LPTFHRPPKRFVTTAIISAFLDAAIATTLDRICCIDIIAAFELRPNGRLIWLVWPIGDLVAGDRVGFVSLATRNLCHPTLV